MLNSNPPPISGPPHFVDLHVNPGESVSIQLYDGNETVLRGPATITMISQHTFPPIPMPVQVPPGHMIQQIVDENGTLRHIILSALNGNNGTSQTPTTLMTSSPQQQQQPQQPFPYCCCCCYSCTGGLGLGVGNPVGTSSPSLPPPTPGPAHNIQHHNILAFPSQPTRRRLPLPTRTYSPAGKRASSAFYNSNTLGKSSPIRNSSNKTSQFSSMPTAASLEHHMNMSVNNHSHKVTYSSTKLGSTSLMDQSIDKSSYELNENEMMSNEAIGKKMIGSNHSDHSPCLSESNLHMKVNNVMVNNNHKDMSHVGGKNGLVENVNVVMNVKPQNTSRSYESSNSYICKNSGNNNSFNSHSLMEQEKQGNKKVLLNNNRHEVMTNNKPYFQPQREDKKHRPVSGNASAIRLVTNEKREQIKNSCNNELEVTNHGHNQNHNHNQSHQHQPFLDLSAFSYITDEKIKMTVNHIADESSVDGEENDNHDNENHDNESELESQVESHQEFKLMNVEQLESQSIDDDEKVIKLQEMNYPIEHDSNTHLSNTNNGISFKLANSMELKMKDEEKSTQIEMKDNVNDLSKPEIITSEKSLPSSQFKNEEHIHDTLEKSSEIRNDDEICDEEHDVDGDKHVINNLDIVSKHEERDRERDETLGDNESDGKEECEDGEMDDEDSVSSSQHAKESLSPASPSPQRSPKHLLPQLQLLNLTYTSLTANTVKLKWTQQSQPTTSTCDSSLYTKHYVVDMMLISKSNNEKDKEKSMVSRIVYQGHSANCRISHLTCQQQYSFRVRTTSHDDSHLVVSNLLTITTPEQQPGNANKNHKKNKQQTLQQQIQLQQQQIQQQQLLLQQQQLQGNVANNKEKDGPRLSSDQRWAILILLLFSSFAVIIAVLIEHFFTN